MTYLPTERSARAPVVIAAGSSPAPFWPASASQPARGVPVDVHLAMLVASWAAAERCGLRLDDRRIGRHRSAAEPSDALRMAFVDQGHGERVSAALGWLVPVGGGGRPYPNHGDEPRDGFARVLAAQLAAVTLAIDGVTVVAHAGTVEVVRHADSETPVGVWVEYREDIVGLLGWCLPLHRRRVLTSPVSPVGWLGEDS